MHQVSTFFLFKFNFIDFVPCKLETRKTDTYAYKCLPTTCNACSVCAVPHPCSRGNTMFSSLVFGHTQGKPWRFQVNNKQQIYRNIICFWLDALFSNPSKGTYTQTLFICTLKIRGNLEPPINYFVTVGGSTWKIHTQHRACCIRL